jgi:hypothetical protein
VIEPLLDLHLDRQRARTDERHVATQYIQQLWQFIRARSAQKPSNPSYPLIVAFGLQIATVASKALWEISWGKPKDYDPNAEKPAAPEFNPRDYTPEQLEVIEAALRIVAKRQQAEPEVISSE